MMKYVEFYRLTDDGQEKVGEVRFVDGAIEFSDDRLRKFLEETAVVVKGKEYWPSDKEEYLKILAYGFSGSYFRASEVKER